MGLNLAKFCFGNSFNEYVKYEKPGAGGSIVDYDTDVVLGEFLKKLLMDDQDYLDISSVLTKHGRRLPLDFWYSWVHIYSTDNFFVHICSW